MSLESIIADLVSAARAAGRELPDLAVLIQDAWNAPPSEWGPDGMSVPDAQGLVRFRALADLRAQYAAAGKHEAAQALSYRYACVPGANACKPGSAAKAVSFTNCQNGSWQRGLGLAVWFTVFDVTATTTEWGTTYRLDYNRPIPDGFVIPRECDTVEKCLSFITEMARRLE